MESQSKIDSLMEAVTNTSIGFVIALITASISYWIYRVPISWSTNLQITMIFTIVSVLRSYCLRRLFNGRSPWQAFRNWIGY